MLQGESLVPLRSASFTGAYHHQLGCFFPSFSLLLFFTEFIPVLSEKIYIYLRADTLRPGISHHHVRIAATVAATVTIAAAAAAVWLGPIAVFGSRVVGVLAARLAIPHLGRELGCR